MVSHEFQIADDNEILKRLGMHKCRKQVTSCALLVTRACCVHFRGVAFRYQNAFHWTVPLTTVTPAAYRCEDGHGVRVGCRLPNALADVYLVHAI